MKTGRQLTRELVEDDNDERDEVEKYGKNY